jgi:hypothetical protein
MARGDVVIPNEPASIAIIGMDLSNLVEWFLHQSHRELERAGSSMHITSINFKTLPATYFANLSSEMGSLGGDPF